MATTTIFWVCLLFSCFTTINAEEHGYLERLGCWSIPRNAPDFIPSVEQTDDDLDGLYWERVQSVLKCAWVAKDHGYKVFAIRSSGECLMSAKASAVYRRYGSSRECHGGEGGHRAMDVYKLKGQKLPEVDDFEGDIILTKLQKAMTVPIPYGDVANDAVWKKVDDKWPERIIPFFIHPKFQNHQLARKLLDGLKPWQKQTCISFIPKKNHRDWVELVREKNPLSRRCASAIGHNGSKQQMRLGDLCPAGSVIHEWGHSIGLWHTQSRSDRDDYIQIMWDNILPGWQAQFSKRSMDILGVQYDYNSIMHYGKNFFAKLSKKKDRLLTTIRTKDTKYQDKIGQRSYLSDGDVNFVNKMYGCPDFPFTWKVKDWGECSKYCGSGIQTRELICAKDDGKKSPDGRCQSSPKPETKRHCYGRKCGYCPKGWHKFKGACYFLQSAKAGWKKARKYCQDKGADLLTVRSKEEELELRQYIEKKGLQYLYFWIGAFYNPTEGGFKWIDDTSIHFDAWKKGEPRFGMDCAILFNRQYWGTDQCLMGRSSICKKELRDYVLPKVQVTDQSQYKWFAGSWGECSVTCGGGQNNRKTYCAGSDGVEVDYSKCPDTPLDAWKECNTQACPSPYRWYIKDWQECTVTCGGGWQRRDLVCAKEDQLATAWELCNHTKTPAYQQRCNSQPCPPKENATNTLAVAQWKTSHWTGCSVTCGTGRQLRHVVCVARNGKRLHEKHCSVSRKPAAVRRCKTTKKCQARIVKKACRDKTAMCHFWRRRHLCHNSHVKKSCRKSCGQCKT